MPIYTYACQTCSGQLEKRQSFSEDPLTIHENCGGSLRRVIHPAGIVFKGSGFYNTDYKNSTGSTKGDAEPAAAEAGKADASSSDSSNGTSTSAESSSSSSSSGGDSSASAASSSSSSAPAAAPAASTP